MQAGPQRQVLPPRTSDEGVHRNPSQQPLEHRRHDITLTLSIPDTGHFRFSSGTLASEYLACENFRHSFAKAGNIITPNQWEDNGVGEVSLRAVCHLDKLSNGRQGPTVKVTFLLLPCNTDQLIELSDSTQSPAWPGLRILESTAEFFPKIPGWEDPICPLLIRGSARGEAPDLPTGQDLRFHTAEIMRTAKRPTVHCPKTEERKFNLGVLNLHI